jgi:hypothetical protein
MSEWQKSTLGKIATGFLSGGTPTTQRPEYWQGDIPWITSKWLGNRLELLDGEKFVSKDAIKKTSTRVVPKNSIIFATRVGVGKVGINRLDLAINQDLAGVLIDNQKFDIEFLAFQLRIDSVQQYVAMNKRGATIKGITRDCLKEIRINLPPLPEQKKILEYAEVGGRDIGNWRLDIGDSRREIGDLRLEIRERRENLDSGSLSSLRSLRLFNSAFKGLNRRERRDRKEDLDSWSLSCLCSLRLKESCCSMLLRSLPPHRRRFATNRDLFVAERADTRHNWPFCVA